MHARYDGGLVHTTLLDRPRGLIKHAFYCSPRRRLVQLPSLLISEERDLFSVAKLRYRSGICRLWKLKFKYIMYSRWSINSSATGHGSLRYVNIRPRYVNLTLIFRGIDFLLYILLNIYDFASYVCAHIHIRTCSFSHCEMLWSDTKNRDPRMCFARHVISINHTDA